MTRRSAVIITSIIAGLALAWLLAPLVFAHLPNDRSRIADVVKLMRTHPKVAIIGNSVAMYGVRTGTHLATSAQTIRESVMIASELAGTETIVIVVTPWQLTANISPNAQGWNAWWLYGLQVSPESRALAGVPSFSDWRERFRSRWVVRASFESLFARGSGQPVGRWVGHEDFRVDPEIRRLLETIAARRKVVVVLAPMSPIVRTHYSNVSLHLSNARVIDASQLLDAGDFRDDTHANDAGTRKLTKFIEERL